ncbi:hypothetical protein [Streptacidiphilus fuscans]|uniref:Uncharacterized protein n=1 Tax=Streptacidiphilus fuscans TaxID=2789292 RepID=A0A931B7U7_9ACTN|nr:hypothetical protein [Streptacidiphilus fuscans]MBF9071818.1 hypothetical protein [Streptacidiphilus fuscans]
MSRFHVPSWLRPTGYWIALGARRVFLEQSALTDQLLAKQRAEDKAERARLLRATLETWH